MELDNPMPIIKLARRLTTKEIDDKLEAFNPMHHNQKDRRNNVLLAALLVVAAGALVFLGVMYFTTSPT